MKTCEYCGSKVEKGEKICPHCGASKFKLDEQNFPTHNTYTNDSYKNNNDQQKDGNTGESKALGVLSIVFGVLFPVVGFILAIIAQTKYKSPANKKLAKAGLTVSIIMLILNIYANSIDIPFLFS